MSNHMKIPLAKNQMNNQNTVVSQDTNLKEIEAKDTKQNSREGSPIHKNTFKKVSERKAMFEKSDDIEETKINERKTSEPASTYDGIKGHHFTGSAAIASLIKQSTNKSSQGQNNGHDDEHLGSSKGHTFLATPAQVKSDTTQDSELIKDISFRSKLEGMNKTDSNMFKSSSNKKSLTGIHRRLTQLLDPNDIQVSKFLAAIANMSSDQEEKTGNCKLDMKGILAAITTATEKGQEMETSGKQPLAEMNGRKMNAIPERDEYCQMEQTEVTGTFDFRGNAKSRGMVENIENAKQEQTQHIRNVNHITGTQQQSREKFKKKSTSNNTNIDMKSKTYNAKIIQMKA